MKKIVFSMVFLAAFNLQGQNKFDFTLAGNDQQVAMDYFNNQLYFLNNSGTKITKTDMNGVVAWTTCYTGGLGNAIPNNYFDKNNRLTHIPDGERVAACGQINGNPGYILVDGSGTIILEVEYDDQAGNLNSIKYFGGNQEVILAGVQDNHPFLAKNGSALGDFQVQADYEGAYVDFDVDYRNNRILALAKENQVTGGVSIIDIYDFSGSLLSSFQYNNSSGSGFPENIEYLGNDLFVVAGNHGGFNSFFAMLHTDGILKWERSLRKTEHNSFDPRVQEIEQDRDGNIIVLWEIVAGTTVGISKFDWSGQSQFDMEYPIGTPGGGLDLLTLQSREYVISFNEGLWSGPTHVIRTDDQGHTGTRGSCESEISIDWFEDEGAVSDLTATSSSVAVPTATTLSITKCTEITDTQGSCCWFSYDPWPGRTAYFCTSATLTVPNDPNLTFSWSDGDGNPLPAGTLSPNNHTREIVNNSETDPLEIKVRIEVTNADQCVGWDEVNIIITPNGELTRNGTQAVYCDPVSQYSTLRLPTMNDVFPGATMTSSYEFNGSPIFENDILNEPALQTAGAHVVQLVVDDNVFGNCTTTIHYEYEIDNCTCPDPIILTEFPAEHSPDKLYAISFPSSSTNKEIYKYRFSMIEDVSNPGVKTQWVLQEDGFQVGSTWWGHWMTPVLSDYKLHNWGPVIGNANRDLMLEVWYAPSSTTIFSPIANCGYEQSIISTYIHSARKANPTGLATDGEESASSLEIYPNPSSSIFLVKGVKNARRIEVFDLLGNLILNVEAEKINDPLLTLDLSGANDGMYLVKILNQDNVSMTKRIIKQ